MSQEKRKVNPMVRWVQGYVATKLRAHKNDLAKQVEHSLNEMNYEISELKRIINQQQSEIERLKTQAAAVHRYDERLGRAEDKIAELSRWKKDAIAAINRLTSIQFNRLEVITEDWKRSSAETQRLARQMGHIRHLCRRQESRVDGADIGPLLDTHASEIPDSGTANPNSQP